MFDCYRIVGCKQFPQDCHPACLQRNSQALFLLVYFAPEHRPMIAGASVNSQVDPAVVNQSLLPAAPVATLTAPPLRNRELRAQVTQAVGLGCPFSV